MSYEKRLLESGSFMTRFAHKTRIKKLIKILQNRDFNNCADLGCADGIMLRRLYDLGLIKAGLGIDTDPEALLTAGQATSGISELVFVDANGMDPKKYVDQFDLVLCLETLEHVRETARMINLTIDLCKKGGTVVISVPIEIGPSVIVKQFGRWLANTKGTYGYERYSNRELVSAFFWKVPQEAVSQRQTANLLGHKGFDFREIEQQISAICSSFSMRYSPFHLGGKWVNSTVYWIIDVNEETKARQKKRVNGAISSASPTS